MIEQKVERPALKAARRIIQRARGNSRDGRIAAFVTINPKDGSWSFATCDASPENPLWVAASANPERMQRCAGVYTEFADLMSVVYDLELLGLK